MTWKIYVLQEASPLNCVANGKILKENIFKNIWIQPAAGDAGGSLGAALAYWHIELNKDRKKFKRLYERFLFRT